MREVLKAIDLLDQQGYYKLADKFEREMLRFAAMPYDLNNEPFKSHFVLWDKEKEEYQQYDDVFWKELKQRLPEYRNLHTDKDEESNLEGELHGPDAVPGPAYVYPSGGAESPSMSGGLDYYEWDVARDENQGPESWKNLVPRR